MTVLPFPWAAMGMKRPEVSAPETEPDQRTLNTEMHCLVAHAKTAIEEDDPDRAIAALDLVLRRLER
jgi:hypothetical protein